MYPFSGRLLMAMVSPALLALGLLMGSVHAAPVLFSDDFNDGVSAAWNNERGAWREVDGVYDATNPDNSPITYSGVGALTGLTDFAVDVRVNEWDDGGIWLRSSYNGGAINGVLLVTGGFGGTYGGLYWHIVTGGGFSGIIGMAQPGSSLQGTDVGLRIEVVGDTYSVFVNGGLTPLSTLTTSAFASGGVGLYDYSPTSGVSSPRGQTFDDFVVTDLTARTPEPGALGLFALGLLVLGVALRRRNRRGLDN